MKKNRQKSRDNFQNAARVQALFLDYDGTISPLNVPIAESKVTSRNMKVLHQVSRRIPVAVISTKDLTFVVERTPFAHAWSGLGGLETKVGDAIDKASCIRSITPNIADALEYARNLSGNDLAIEEKKDSSGTTVAFSVDWRQAKNKSRAEKNASKIVSYCERSLLVATRFDKQPFVDIFPCAIDKGKALTDLKQKLGLNDGILYMGDSTADNSAFALADISVGVIHEETSETLACNYFVKFENVADFLRELLKNDLRFNNASPKILQKNEVLKYSRHPKTYVRTRD